MRAITVAFLFAVLPLPAAPAQPSSSVFDGDLAVITILIRPDKTADFEAVLDKLKQALQRSTRPQRKAQAAGWRIYKSLESAQGNAVYVMQIDPVIRGQEYDITRIIAEEFPADVTEIAQRYRGAFVDRSVAVADKMTISGLGASNSGSKGGNDRATPPPLLTLDADAALVTFLIRPDKTADLESTLGFLGRSLQASGKAGRREQAAGLRVFRSNQLINGNAVYIMSIDPVIQNQEYDIIRLIAEAFPAEIQAIFQKYRDAFVARGIARLKLLMTLGL